MSFYKITFTGEILQGFEKESVKQNLMKLFGLNESQAEKVLMKPGTTLKKQVDEENRVKYEALLAEAGIKTETVAISETSSKSKLHAESEPVEQPSGSNAKKANEKTVSFSFTGDGKQYFGIWIRNALLTLITCGIYSAWAKIKKKQYFLKHTTLGGIVFDYAGDPKTILKGRAVLAMFIALYLVSNSLYQPLALVVLILALISLPWLIVGTLVFNAQSTSYSNIHFRFNATYKEAVVFYLFWPLLAILSMGVLAPYAFLKQQKFVLEHSSFGSTSFHFNPKTHEFYWLVLRVLLILLAGMGITMVFSIIFSPSNLQSKLIFVLFYIARLIPFVIVLLIVIAYFSVSYSILLFNATNLSALGFESNFSIIIYMKMFLLNGLAVLVTFGLYYPWAVVRLKKYKAQCVNLSISGGLKDFIQSELTKPKPEINQSTVFFNSNLSL